MSIYAPLISALITFLLSYFLLSSRVRDVPNERSLHSKPVPRIGGVSLMAGMLCGWALIFNALVWWVILPFLILFFVSLLDDIFSLPVKHRLLVHFLCAVILVTGVEFFQNQGGVAAMLILLFVVWMTNLFNFMDGSDGLAGGMSFFGFGVFGLAGLIADNTLFSLFNFCIASAAASFLYFNFSPAKIFMGDSGSIPLGFLVAAMGLWGWQQSIWPIWFPLVVFSPFIVDASVTLVKRTLQGNKVTEAHREHYYQRLVQMGWRHRTVALAEYSLMIALGASSLLEINNPFPWLMFLAWSAVYACLLVLLDMQWKIFKRGKDV